MIRKLVRQMLTAQIFSALAVSLCLLIDNVMISRFLGSTGMAAYSLANPVLLGIGAIASLLAAGVQVSCSKSLGKGSREETDAGYSSAIVLGGGISLAFAAAVLLLRNPLAAVMGAGSEGALFEQTRDYLVGFSIGAPGSVGALVLIPFLQLAGQSNLLIAAVLLMAVVDIALDLLNVLCLHWGMFGMGLASSLSFYAALVLAASYFLSSRCVFRFSRKRVRGKKIAELFQGGIPAGFNMASSVVLVFLLNQVLKSTGGETAIAAYAVVSGIGNAANCITTGVGGVSLTLSGILFNEEDREGLKELIRLLTRYSVMLGLGMGMLLILLAPALVSVFIAEAGQMRDMAILGLRLFATGMIPCCINNAMKSLYQSIGQEKRTMLISVLEGMLFPGVAAVVLGMTVGTNGVWLHFVVGEAMTLLFISLMIWKKTGKMPWAQGACLLMDKGFGAIDNRLLERKLHSLEEMKRFVMEAEQFCLDLKEDEHTSRHIALCIEEIASNVIRHGFAADRKEHHLSVRLLGKEDRWVLRFRDDCRAFDPLELPPERMQQALGIRLALAMAEKANYTYSMNMNNLTLQLRRK